MKIEKKFTINAPIEKVWDIITDPKLIAQCIPGCKSVEEVEENKYKASIEVVVGPIKTKFLVDITETEREKPNYAVYDTSGDEGGKANRVKAKSRLTLTALDEASTEVCVVSDFNIVGRLGKFGSGMMNKIIDVLSADTISALAAFIERGELPSAKKGKSKLTLIAIGILLLIIIGVLALVLY